MLQSHDFFIIRKFSKLKIKFINAYGFCQDSCRDKYVIHSQFWRYLAQDLSALLVVNSSYEHTTPTLRIASLHVDKLLFYLPIFMMTPNIYDDTHHKNCILITVGVSIILSIIPFWEIQNNFQLTWLRRLWSSLWWLSC